MHDSSYGEILLNKLQETGAALRPEEIGHAFQFGYEGTVRNVLEPNWWETKEHQLEQQQLASEALRLEKERREDEEDEAEEEKVEVNGHSNKEEKPEFNGSGGEERVIARTRVSFLAPSCVRELIFDPAPIQARRSGGVQVDGHLTT